MFKGFVLSESLNDPTILNDFENIYVKVESHPESELKYWHLFKLKIKDEDIEDAVKLILKNIKKEWYAHFWNGKVVYICYSNKIFKITQQKKREWNTKEYYEAKNYGIQQGIAERYLDFWIEEES
jgi:hypothetical protein